MNRTKMQRWIGKIPVGGRKFSHRSNFPGQFVDSMLTRALLLLKGFPGYHTGYINPPDQRRTPGGQYYAEYATINNQGARSGPNRPPDIPQVTPAMQDYADYSGTKFFKSFLHLSIPCDHILQGQARTGGSECTSLIIKTLALQNSVVHIIANKACSAKLTISSCMTE